VCRLHNLVMELSPGGIAKELNASDAIALLERVVPGTPVETARHDLALGANLPRLREIKARYDPDRLFRAPQCL
jgi:FAD/FMN-containing dehydrogenase